MSLGEIADLFYKAPDTQSVLDTLSNEDELVLQDAVHNVQNIESYVTHCYVNNIPVEPKFVAYFLKALEVMNGVRISRK